MTVRSTLGVTSDFLCFKVLEYSSDVGVVLVEERASLSKMRVMLLHQVVLTARIVVHMTDVPK